MLENLFCITENISSCMEGGKKQQPWTSDAPLMLAIQQ
jgi:hypothetical protein